MTAIVQELKHFNVTHQLRQLKVHIGELASQKHVFKVSPILPNESPVIHVLQEISLNLLSLIGKLFAVIAAGVALIGVVVSGGLAAVPGIPGIVMIICAGQLQIKRTYEIKHPDNLQQTLQTIYKTHRRFGTIRIQNTQVRADDYRILNKIDFEKVVFVNCHLDTCSDQPATKDDIVDGQTVKTWIKK